jgi:acyl-CoA synthetase (AMP-forming)/AMP-acid ligase II
MRHFEPARALEMIERERATWIYTMFPPVTMELIKHPSFAERNFDSVRAIANVGPRETLDLISRSFAPVPHLQGQFGMTEGSGSMTANYLSDSPEDRIATSGKPLDGTEFAVIDIDTGRRLGTGERGELTFRGPGVFRGYYADSIATADALDADGWVHSGDLGEMTEDGRIIYHGRVKEMLKVGGENVAPAEIESHIATLAAVSQVHVVPAPDERLDEVPAAFIELVPGLTLTAEDVVVHCRESIASFKVPRYVRFVTEWPMSATKVQKATLRANIKTEIEAGISGEGSDR